LTQAFTLLALVALHLAVTTVIFIASLLVGLALGARRPLALLTSGLLGLAATGYAAVFLYLASASIGRFYSVAVMAVSAVLCAGLLASNRGRIAPLARPMALTGVSVLFVISLGFVYGDIGHPMEVPSIRFSNSESRLASDNAIPFFFAQALYGARRPIPSPLFDDWLSSDRPPLQTGLTLVQMPLFRWGPTPYLQYQVVGVIVQSLWVLGLWAWLFEARVGQAPSALALGSTLFTGFALLNTFYVWPKLLAAAFLLLLVALLVRALNDAANRLALGSAAGFSAGFSMVSHEGSVFALAGIALLLLLRRRLPPVKFVGAAAVCLVLVMAPWWWYQKAYDPPGDRLLKYHLADAPNLTKNSFLTLAVANYDRLGVAGTAEYKSMNFVQLFASPNVRRTTGPFAGQVGDGNLIADATAAVTRQGSIHSAAARIRSDLFFEFFPGLGVMAFGPLALIAEIARRRKPGPAPPELQAARFAWAAVALSLVVWCLVMFGPATTVPFQGTYAIILLALAGSLLAFWSLDRRLAYVAAGLQVALNALLYVVLAPEPGGLLSSFTSGLNPYLAMTAAAAAAGVVALLAKWRSTAAPFA
jgi:hypothetical protein